MKTKPKQSLCQRSAVWTYLLLLALTWFAAHANAQYRFTQWTADFGLPQNSVRGLVQTPEGYIWVATLNGVARFDGMRFTTFDKSNTPGISSSRFTAMVRGLGNDLWLSSEDGNLVRLHDGKFFTLGPAEGVRPYSIVAITSDDTGNVWIEEDDRVLQWDAHARRFARVNFSTDDLHFEPLWWVSTGFWALDGRHLVLFERGHLRRISIPSEVKEGTIGSVAFGADGVTWLRTADHKLAQISAGSFQLRNTSYVTPMLDPHEAHWEVEVSADRFQRKLHFPTGREDRPITYNVLLHDVEGNLWVGSEGEGLFRIQRQSIRVISKANGLASNNVYPVLRAHDGDIWVGSWPVGVSQIHDGHVVRNFGKDEGIPGLVSALAEDRDGTLWIGTHSGVRIFRKGKISSPSLPISSAGPVAQVIHQAPDGTMLFGTPHGLYLVSGTNWRHLTPTEGLASEDVRVIITDHRGDVWLGGYGGLTRMHNGQLTRWTEANGLPSNSVRCIVEDSSGDIWVGTYDGGIGWLRNGKWTIFNKKNDLYDNGAFQILEDTAKNFWISSNRGIYRVQRGQLAAVADHREALVNSIAYGRADGMLSVECNGGLWPAGAKDANGALWFPTQLGVAVIDPLKVRNVHQAPKVIIENVSVDRNQQPSSSQVMLRPGQANLQIDYTALSYTKPEQITFTYQLKGIDDGWQPVGTRRTAYYSHLPPGEYTFSVAAQNSDGVLSGHDAVLRVVVVPPFYRRWWFLSLLTALLVSGMATAWKLRVRQLEGEQEKQQRFSRELIASQEAERRRIAAELHDSLGQRLIVINNLALFLLRKKGKVRTEEEKEQTIVEINQEAGAAIEETRAISYALRPFQLDRLGLTRAIQALCNTVSKASDMHVATSLADIDDAFPEQLRINVYRIVQEALNNVVKHSGATQAQVNAVRSKDKIVITIADNGRGMEAEPRSTAANTGGFGMTGMRERTTLLNGTLQVKPDVPTGTLVELEIPIPDRSKI